MTTHQKQYYLHTMSLSLYDAFTFFISSTTSSLSTPPLLLLPSITTAITTSNAKLKSNKKCPPILAKNTSQKNGSQTITAMTNNPLISFGSITSLERSITSCWEVHPTNSSLGSDMDRMMEMLMYNRA
mmetsp:Transcript_23981/g.47628  ORF Transcript_23981/g.47628 Transcript_23981/m.47628 type:complete len:128 (+) Transcript_23981:2870-3253(+)